jgi:hypothetical protein
MLKGMTVARTMTLREAYEAFQKEWIVIEVEPGSCLNLDREGVVRYHGLDRQKAEALGASRCSDPSRELQVLYGTKLLPDGVGLMEAIAALERGEVEIDPRVLERWF